MRHSAALAMAFGLAFPGLACAQDPRPDPFAPVRFLAGEWRGVLDAAQGSPTKLVFESEAFENFSNKWHARETYEIVSPDEFTETFELAAPAKSLAVYSRNHFKRMR